MLSRVLESFISNIVAHIDVMLYVDDLTKHFDPISSLPKVSVISHKSIFVSYSMFAQITHLKQSFCTPSFSPSRCISPTNEAKSPFINRNNLPLRGVGVNRVLTYFGSIERKENFVPTLETFEEVPTSTTFDEVVACEANLESNDFEKKNMLSSIS